MTDTGRRLEEVGAYYDASIPPALYADPRITALNPNTVAASVGAITVTVTGRNFEAGSVVEVAQVAQPTTFVSSTALTISYNPTVAATVGFSVRNPNAEESNSVPFVVTAGTAEEPEPEPEPETAEEPHAEEEPAAEEPPASGSGSSTTPAKRSRSKTP